jgi:hypothetical protein
MSGKSKVLLVALFVACLVATQVVAQAQAAARTSANVPANLRSSVLNVGAQCRHIIRVEPGAICGGTPAMFKYLDHHPSKRARNYSMFRKFYFNSAAICNKLRPGKNDGKLTTAQTFWQASYTDFECVWGNAITPYLGLRIMIKLPNAGHLWRHNNCNYYIGYQYDSCTPLGGGVQATRNYFAGDSELVLDSKKGFVSLRRFAPDDAQYYAHLADDNVMFYKIDLALGLPVPSAD